jgi:hypothetical protein
MRWLSVQVQPDQSPGVDMGPIALAFEAVASLKELVEHHSFSSGHDKGSYFTFMFGTPDALQLWETIRTHIYENEVFGRHLRQSSIAVCSDDNGSWDDYRLLHHFDPDVELDSPSDLGSA